MTDLPLRQAALASSHRSFLIAGMGGEIANIIGVLGINVFGPRYLGLVEYGDYSRVMGSAFIALGLINGPLASRVLLRREDQQGRSILQGSALTATGALVVSLGFAGLRGLDVAAGMTLAAAYSLVSYAVHLAYRRRVLRLYPVLAAFNAVIAVTALYLSGVAELGGEIAAIIQGAAILAGAVVGLVVVSGYSTPADAWTDDTTVPATTFTLSVPSVMTGVVQWVLVLLVGRMGGSADASIARVGTSIMSIPATLVPITGALLFSSAMRDSRPERRAARLLLVVLLGAVSIGSVVFLLREIVMIVLGGGGYRALEPHFAWLMAGGVGLAAIKTGWLFTVGTILPVRAGKAAAAAMTGMAVIAALGGLAGWTWGLALMAIAYLCGGGFVAGLIILALQRHMVRRPSEVQENASARSRS